MMNSANGRKLWCGAVALFLALALTLTPFHTAKALTADELARHLGVQYWDTTVGLPPGSFVINILKISGGKVEQEGPGFGGDSNDPSGSHLVIMMSSNQGKPKATIMIGTASSISALPLSENFLPLAGTLELPKKIKAGDYILGGMWKKKDGIITATDNIADIESGLLLRITAN